MLQSDESNRFLSPASLEALSKARSEDGVIFSLYLDMRYTQDSLDRFEEILRQTAEQANLDKAPGDYREQWNQDANRIRGWLKQERLAQGSGLAIFSSHANDLWQVYLLPAPVPDRLEVKSQPFTRPLEVLLGEFQCALVALIDAGAARLAKVYFGQAEEIGQMEAVPVTGSEREMDNPHVRAVIEQVQDAWAEHGCGRLIIGGSGDVLEAFREALPIAMRERLAGEVTLSPQAGLDEILTEALAVDQAHERQIEAQRVDELITGAASGGNAVLGLEQTLRSVAGNRKVRVLVAEEDFHAEGGECPNCGFLSTDEQGICLMCGMSMREEPDIVEAALKRVLDEGGEIEILRSPTSRRGLEAHGRIGALLHDATEAQLRYKETANQQALTIEGEIQPKTARDETVEESFPASDPPSSW